MREIRNKLSKIPKGVKASIAFFVANAISAGIAYITTPLYTRLLSSTEFGQVSIYLTWKQVFGIVAMFCLSYGVFNNGMSDFPEKRDEYSFSMLILSNVITMITAGMFILLYPLVKNIIKLDIDILLLMGITFFVLPAYNFWVTRQVYELKYRYTTLWTIVTAICSPAIAMLCIFLFSENKVYARLIGAEGSLVILYVFFYIYLGKHAHWKLNTKYWKAAFLFNLPLIPHYLSTYLLNSSDKIMISYFIGDNATAYYSVAYSVAQVGIIVWSAANASLVPFTYGNCAKKKYKKIADVTQPIVLLFAVVCILIILLAPEVVAIMATKEYIEAIYVIPPVVGGVFFQVQYYMYANVVYYYKKPKYVMYGSVIATLINVALNYVFIKKFGYYAAGYTTLFSYLIQAVFDYWAMKHVVGESIYNMKFICSLSAVVLVISLVSNLLYGTIAIRYFMVLMLGVCIVLFRKKIFDIIQTLKQ